MCSVGILISSGNSKNVSWESSLTAWGKADKTKIQAMVASKCSKMCGRGVLCFYSLCQWVYRHFFNLEIF